MRLQNLIVVALFLFASQGIAAPPPPSVGKHLTAAKKMIDAQLASVKPKIAAFKKAGDDKKKQLAAARVAATAIGKVTDKSTSRS